MSERQQRFIDLLNQIFELDKSDLDFGIYRILNIRRDEIRKYFEDKLPAKITEILTPFAIADNSALIKRIQDIESQFGGADQIAQLSTNLPIIQEYHQLKSQLQQGADLSALESDVYGALYSFFSRYYDEGDFISKRRYKEGVYAIPYEGEEVKLYWANQDQYYIKTSENFKDYTFLAGDYTISFRLVDATTEQNNNKEADDKKRKFMLFEEDEQSYPGIKTFEVDGKNVTIRFRFDIPNNPKQNFAETNLAAIKLWLSNQPDTQLLAELMKNVSGNPRKVLSMLEKHLQGYVAKNTFDYFIHKDLGDFLRRELDFFIKNEIMHLDDIDTDNAQRVETYLAKVRAIKKVGNEIITFLAQMEDFQKKLWLKKKFVVETQWCIRLDMVPEEFLSEIASNTKQISEWKEIFPKSFKGNEVIDEHFLRFNSHLELDTRYFDNSFKQRLIAKLDDIESHASGELLQGDNFHANNLLIEKYAGKVKCIYIDPPFNLEENGDFLYRTNYCSSSWLSLLKDRLLLAKKLLTSDGCIFVRCDYHGNSIIKLLMSEIFGESNYKNEIIINRFQKAADGLTNTTESLFFYSAGEDFKINSVDKPRVCVYCKTPIEPKWGWSHSAGEGTLPRYFTVNGERVLLYPPKGRHWTNKQEAIDELEAQGRIRIDFSTKYIDCNGNRVNYIPEKLQASTIDVDNNWTDIPGYEFGVFTKEKFSTQNSEELLERVIKLGSKEGDLVLDFFMGSATTQAVAQKLGRKWIGVDMGEYFYNIPLKRMKSLSPQIFKYMRLESYEDALSNIELKKNSGMEAIFGDDYYITYMLNLEAKDSLLNIGAFRTPFSYEMKITEKNESKQRSVDVVETFNYLIGLTIQRQGKINSFNALPAQQPEYEGAVNLRYANNGEYAFLQIEGKLRDGRRALIIWRTLGDDLLASNAALDAYFLKYRINPQDREYDVIYVNGDNNIENLRQDSENWKVLRIEEVFNKKMFE